MVTADGSDSIRRCIYPTLLSGDENPGSIWNHFGQLKDIAIIHSYTAMGNRLSYGTWIVCSMNSITLP